MHESSFAGDAPAALGSLARDHDELLAGRALRLALGAALLVLAAGCVGPVASLYPPAPHGPAEPVWIVDHGWHTGLVLERASIPAGLLPEQDDFPGALFLEVGWGDADFYRAREPGLGAALHAAVASRASVIHVLGLRVRPEKVLAARDVVEVRLSRPGFEALARFVHDGFDRQGRRVTLALGNGLSGAGAFYPSRERYSLLNTCNTWVARALRAAGAPITPAYALTAGNLMWQVRRLPSVVVGGISAPTGKPALEDPAVSDDKIGVSPPTWMWFTPVVPGAVRPVAVLPKIIRSAWAIPGSRVST